MYTFAQINLEYRVPNNKRIFSTFVETMANWERVIFWPQCRHDDGDHLFDLEVSDVPVILELGLMSVPDLHETQRCISRQSRRKIVTVWLRL